MVFSSVVFLYYFLPAVMLLYFALPAKNAVLLIASIVFYAWGEFVYVLILLASILMNYALGALIDRSRGEKSGRILLIAGIVANLAPLGFFKYGNFIVENIGRIPGIDALFSVQMDPVHLPLGISFFTFQAMSYLVDVYRGTVRASNNPLHVGLYISMFPQLVAGPIVRFNHIAANLHRKNIATDTFADGIRRFTIGLSQKMLIANTLAATADSLFALPSENLSFGVAWLATAAYSLQIYFDFAGYSSMAIGLGLILGFQLPENFDFPYISQSISEFWRRWHITLSSWFRDYLYIPLGGNRRGKHRTYFNLFVVFLLCGLWHGASWNFVVWGVYHGCFLVLERIGFGAILEKSPRPVRHLYALAVVAVGWVFFRAETMGQAFDFLSAMAGLAHPAVPVQGAWHFLDPGTMIAGAVAVLFSTKIPVAIAARFAEGAKRGQSSGDVMCCLGRIAFGRIAEAFVVFFILLWVGYSLASKTHNPFIYFRF